MEEAKRLLEYETPALRELELGLAFGMNEGGMLDRGASCQENDGVFGAEGDSGEENATYSLDDY